MAVGVLGVSGCLGDGERRERISELEDELEEHEKRIQELEGEIEEFEEDLSNQDGAENVAEPWEDVVAVGGADDPTMVSADASANDGIVEVVYYGDFACPACVSFERDSFEDLKDEYIATGDVRFVFRPVDFMAEADEDSHRAALGAQAVWEQEPGVYWTWHRTMFANYDPRANWASPSEVGRFASGVGADGYGVTESVAQGGHADAVQKHRSQAREDGIRGTPSFVIEDETVVTGGDYGSLTGEIDSFLS